MEQLMVDGRPPESIVTDAVERADAHARLRPVDRPAWSTARPRVCTALAVRASGVPLASKYAWAICVQ